MLAHSAEPADLGSDLLKLSDMPIMMATDPYQNDPIYTRMEGGFNNDHLPANPQQYYHQHYDQGYHQFHAPAPPQQQQQQQQQHQQLEPHHDYYQQQQMMYSQPNQGMPGYHYQPSHMNQYGYYQHPGAPPPHQGGYPFQSNQSVMVNSGPSSHGSQNCTPSPHANSDDSGGDCVNEPKLLQLGGPGQYSGQPATPPIPPYPSDLPPSSMGLTSKAAISSSVMNRSVTAARRGKKSKHRDPNEPQKPVSAYALFFRDMQAGIKVRNPNSSFGEVSKHVASMWESLDPDHKSIYKRRTETAKKEYLKRLAAYRASLVSKGGGSDPSISPNSDSFGGPRFMAGFENGLAIPASDRKDPIGPGRDFNSSSPPSKMSPNIGSPQGLPTNGDRSPISSKGNPNLISSVPPPAYPTTSTTSTSFSMTPSGEAGLPPHWSQSRPNMMMPQHLQQQQQQLQQQPQQSSQNLHQQQQQQQRPQFS